MLTINYEKKLCVYSISLYRVCYYFFYKSLNKLVEKQNDFKQNKSWEKNANQFFYASMVRKILVIITLFLFEKDSKKKL